MAPPRSRAAPSKRNAAPSNPSPDPDPTAVDEFNLHLLQAARKGDLRLLKRLVRALDKSRRDPREVLEAAKEEDGAGALHIAARNGRLPVCRYLVEEIGVDVDAVDRESLTPLLCAIFGGSMDTIRYLLDRGANPEKADDNAFAPLHHAAGEGDREMAELLLAKGVPVDPVSFGGTPLHVAAMEGHDEIVQILLENNADCNKIAPGVDTPLVAAIVGSSVKCVKLLIEAGADVNDGLISPLAAAAEIKGLTACLELLLEAGADPNVSDPFGRFPIELAAMKGSREDVEILFPVTYCIPTVPDWSIDGIIRHATVSMKQVEHVRRIADLKSLAVKAIKRNNYVTAAIMYSTAMEHDHHDATLYSKRSLCWLRMGDGHKALQDALAVKNHKTGPLTKVQHKMNPFSKYFTKWPFLHDARTRGVMVDITTPWSRAPCWSSLTCHVGRGRVHGAPSQGAMLMNMTPQPRAPYSYNMTPQTRAPSSMMPHTRASCPLNHQNGQTPPFPPKSSVFPPVSTPAASLMPLPNAH